MRFSGGSMRTALATAAALVGLGAGAAPALAAETVYGLTADDKLVSFSSANPGVTSAPLTVTGLGAGEDLLGIDFRPATGQLYGVTRAAAAGRVYRIDQATGAATLITAIPFTLDGAEIGFDFNPPGRW